MSAAPGGSTRGHGPDQHQADAGGRGVRARPAAPALPQQTATGRSGAPAQAAEPAVPAPAADPEQAPAGPDPAGSHGPDTSSPDTTRSPASGQEPDLVITIGGTFTPAPPGDAAPAAARPAPSAPPAAGLGQPGSRPTAAAPPRPAQTAPAPSAPPARPSRHRPAAAGAGLAPAAAPEDELARRAGEYVAGRPGQQISILLAGCVTAGPGLGDRLRAAGHDVTVTLIDDDQPVTRAAVGGQPGLARCTLGDLRIVPMPPRSCDLVLCALLLDRIQHSELVLDRLTTAVKPGGALILRIRDRDCAAGFLDRVFPWAVRRRVWRRRWPGLPGPHPAIYEPLSSARGIHAYAQLHGLVVVERRALGGRAGTQGRPPLTVRASQRFVSWLSRGRLSAAHDELLYVLRKPEDPFARML